MGHRRRHRQAHADHHQQVARRSAIHRPGRPTATRWRTWPCATASLASTAWRPAARARRSSSTRVRAGHADRLVAGRTLPDLLLHRSHRRRPLRAPARRRAGPEADRGLPQQVAESGPAALAGQPLHVVHLQRLGALRDVRGALRSERGARCRGHAHPDLRSRRHGHGILAPGRQGVLLPGRGPGNDGG